jgi:hypothetical protein
MQQVTRHAFGQAAAATRLVWVLPLLSFLFTGGAAWYFSRNVPVTGWNPDTILDPMALVIAVVYPLLGAFIASRRPGNSTGWLFCLMGLVAGLYQFSMQYSIYAYVVRRQPLPLAAEMSWVQSWAWFVPLVLILLLVLHFPDGRALSRAWQASGWVLAASIPLMIVVTFVLLWPFRGEQMFLPEEQMSEAALRSQRILRSFWAVLIGIPLFGGVPLAVIALLTRLRRAGDVEKQQIKWFLYAGGIFSTGLALTLALMLNPPAERYALILWNSILPALVTLIPASVAVGILRYKLFDIDLIIRRTLVYSVVTTVLAGIYLVSVILFQTIIRSITGDESTLAVVASTLLIAALFSPLRQRFQRTLDRRFFRSRYNPERLVAYLTAAMQSEVDIDRLALSLFDTVDTAVRPENLSLWLIKTAHDSTYSAKNATDVE